MFGFIKFIAWFLTVICFRIKRSGAENIPASGPVILVCNHIHMMDVACIYAQVRRRVFFMAKKELFQNKFLARLFRSFGAFPVALQLTMTYGFMHFLLQTVQVQLLT